MVVVVVIVVVSSKPSRGYQGELGGIKQVEISDQPEVSRLWPKGSGADCLRGQKSQQQLLSVRRNGACRRRLQVGAPTQQVERKGRVSG